MSNPGSSVLGQRAVLVRWPEEAERRAALAAEGVTCLLVVEPGAAPPLVEAGEDWIRRTADERDVAARLERLGRSSRPPAGGAPIVLPSDLSPTAHRAALRLASSPGCFVPVHDLAVDDLSDDELDDLVASLCSAFEPCGVTLTAIGRHGFLLERAGSTSP